MIKLSEALTAEREKRLRAEADNSTRQQIGQAVLEALAQRLNAEPIFGWVFVLDDQKIRVFRINVAGREEVGLWTVDEEMRLVTDGRMTEWITAESYGRVIDEALQITAMLIVAAETAGAKKSNNGANLGEGTEIVELPPRF